MAAAPQQGVCQHCGFLVGLTEADDSRIETGGFGVTYISKGRPGGLIGLHDCLVPHDKPHRVDSRNCPGSLCPPKGVR